ncbi:hypothetical protein KFU94_40860 [Chloroflexi bacterium TSY]|nr:hypothetical protein [Chloroflexi bacterium TSY]
MKRQLPRLQNVQYYNRFGQIQDASIRRVILVFCGMIVCVYSLAPNGEIPNALVAFGGWDIPIGAPIWPNGLLKSVSFQGFSKKAMFVRFRLSRSKFGVFGDFQSRLQGFWSHLFRFRLQKTTYFISENRPNLTQKLDIDRQICIYVNCLARILSQNLKFGSTEAIEEF